MGGCRVPVMLRAGASAEPGTAQLPAASVSPMSHPGTSPRDTVSQHCHAVPALGTQGQLLPAPHCWAPGPAQHPAPALHPSGLGSSMESGRTRVVITGAAWNPMPRHTAELASPVVDRGQGCAGWISGRRLQSSSHVKAPPKICTKACMVPGTIKGMERRPGNGCSPSHSTKTNNRLFHSA